MSLLRREKLADRLASADALERSSAAKDISERKDIDAGDAVALVAAFNAEQDEAVRDEMLRAIVLHLLNLRRKYEIEKIYGRELGRKEMELLETLETVQIAMAAESAPDDLRHFSKDKRLRAARILTRVDTLDMKAADALIDAYRTEENDEIQTELLRALTVHLVRLDQRRLTGDQLSSEDLVMVNKLAAAVEAAVAE